MPQVRSCLQELNQEANISLSEEFTNERVARTTLRSLSNTSSDAEDVDYKINLYFTCECIPRLFLFVKTTSKLHMEHSVKLKYKC